MRRQPIGRRRPSRAIPVVTHAPLMEGAYVPVPKDLPPRGQILGRGSKHLRSLQITKEHVLKLGCVKLHDSRCIIKKVTMKIPEQSTNFLHITEIYL